MSRRSVVFRLGLILLGAVVVLLALAAVTAWWWLDRPLPLTGASAEISIETGATPRDVAQAWIDAGVQTSPRLLYEWFRWSRQARHIRAGSYEIDTGTSPRHLLAKMVQGDEALEQVRFIEGWTLRQLRAELARAPALKPTTASLSEAELMTTLGAPRQRGEGRFFPDTYAYSAWIWPGPSVRPIHR
jgi:UPF0755 protein